MANFGPLTAEICWRFSGAPASFNTFCVLIGFVTAVMSLSAGQLNFARLHDVCDCTMFGFSWLVHYVYIFGGCCLVTGFCQVQNSLCVQVLRSPILAASLQGTQAADVSQTLRHGIRSGIRELLQWEPPVFAWVAIMLAISPHSSFV